MPPQGPPELFIAYVYCSESTARNRSCALVVGLKPGSSREAGAEAGRVAPIGGTGAGAVIGVATARLPIGARVAVPGSACATTPRTGSPGSVVRPPLCMAHANAAAPTRSMSEILLL